MLSNMPTSAKKMSISSKVAKTYDFKSFHGTSGTCVDNELLEMRKPNMRKSQASCIVESFNAKMAG